jgi:phosphatidylglycerophosphate synthase
MISAHLKPQVTRLINPVVKLAVRAGITANGVTIVGALGTLGSAFYFYPRGDLFIGTLAICFFALSDLFDGAIARVTNGTGTAWGGFLDSTIDRVTDSAILIGVLLYMIDRDQTVSILILIALVSGSQFDRNWTVRSRNRNCATCWIRSTLFCWCLHGVSAHCDCLPCTAQGLIYERFRNRSRIFPWVVHS